MPTVQPTINATTNILNVADTTNYAAIPFFLDVLGITRIEYPAGLMYQNAGYALSNYGSPDINYPGTMNFDTAIPLVASAIPEGTYTVKYKTRVSKQTTLLNVDLGTNSVSLDIAVTDVVAGGTIVLAGGANDGTYTVQLVSTDLFGRKITLVQPLSSAVATGTFTWTVDSSVETSYDYCAVNPAPKITQEYFCDTNPPLFISTDTSTYSITCDGVQVLPTTINRVHTVKAPDDAAGSPVAGPWVTSVAQSVITQLWTKTWTTVVVTTLTYTLPSGLIVVKEVTAMDQIPVTCDNTLCCLAECINNVRAAYLTALDQNSSAVPELLEKLTALNADYMMYNLYKTCGENDKLAALVTEIKSRLGSTCDCGCDSDDEVPTQIIPAYPIAINGNTAVVVPGSVYITVTPNTVGSTTTYTVDLSVSNVQALIAAYIAANPSIITTIVNSMELGVAVSSLVIPSDVAVAFTGNTTNLNDTITNVAMLGGLSISDLKLFDPIICNQFPLGTYIIAIGATTVQVSNPATATVVGASVVVSSLDNGTAVVKYKRNVSGVDMFVYIAQSSVQDSIVIDGSTKKMKLSGDSSSPGNDMAYATNGVGTKGWRSIATLFGAAVSSNRSTVNATIPTATEVIGNTLNLAAGTYIIMTNALIVGGYVDQIFARLKDGATILKFMGIDLDNTNSINNNTATIIMVYTSASPIVLTAAYQAGLADRVNSLRDRDLIAIKIA